MMRSAPKFRAAVRRRAALGGSAARCLYRFCYILLVLAAGITVGSRLWGARIPPLVSGKSSSGEKGGSDGRRGDPNDQRVGAIDVQNSALDSKQEHLRRWIVKPNSLCFGRGNITILSVAIDLPQVYLELLRSNRLAYAGIHNYRYCEVGVVMDYTRHRHWTKVKATSLVLSFAETVMHIDADALIVNHSISIQSILERFNASKKDVVYSSDFKQGGQGQGQRQQHDGEIDIPTKSSHISSAVYIMRSTPWSKGLLEAEHKLYREASLFNKYEEQDALNLYRMKHAEECAQHIGIVSFRHMNSPCSENYNFYEPGDFIAHFAEGRSPEKYIRLASSFTSKKPHEKSCSKCECFLDTVDVR